MTLSRSGPWLLVVACTATPAEGQIAVDYRLPPVSDPPIRTEIRPGCPPTTSDEEIVVCGTRDDDRYRVAPSDTSRSASHRAGGEQMQALADGTPSRCTTVGPNQQCTRGIDMIGLLFGILRAVAQARGNRD